MSNVIDKRVVEMEFENRQFEKGVQATIKSLENLEEKLQFKDGERGFDRVASAANSMRLGDLERNVDSINSKFTLLGNLGYQALTRISSAVVQTGEKILKMFTIDPVMDGWGEFEVKTNSIQTILAGVRDDFNGDEVRAINAISGALDQLNQYADDTIYSFSDMTANIGKFTNQGVPLQDSVDAIKGISNWAAVAGANTQQASHAMYNLAQALSGGAVRLIDWKSIENANMATEEFRNLAIAVAEATDNKVKNGMVRVGKKLINVSEDFRDSLKGEWLTNDVLIDALRIYSGDLSEAEMQQKGFTEEQIQWFMEIGAKAQEAATTVRTFTQLIATLKEAAGSGWARTFDILFGGFEGTKEFFTTVNNLISPIIDRGSNLRNFFVDLFANTYGGKDKLTGALYSLLSLFSEIDEIGNVALEVVGKMMIVPERLADGFEYIGGVIDSIRSWLNEHNEFNGYSSAWQNLYDIIKGVTSTIVTLYNIISEAVAFVINLAGLLSPILDVVLSIFGEIGNEIFYANYYLSKSNGIHDFFDWLYSILSPIVSSIATLIATVLKFIWTGAKLAKAKIVEWFSKFGTLVEDLPKKLEKLSEKIAGFFDKVKKGFNKIGKIKFKGQMKPIEKLRTVLMTFVDSVLGNDALLKAADWFDNTFKPLFGDLINWAGEKWGQFKSFVSGIPQRITDFVGKFKKGWESMKNVKYDKTLTPLQNFSNKMSELIYAIFDEDTANKIRDAWNNDIYPVIANAISWIESNVLPVVDTVTSFIERAWKGLSAAVTDSGENGLQGRVLAFFRVFNNDEDAELPESFKKLFAVEKEIEKWKNETLTPFLIDAKNALPNLWSEASKALFGYEETDERYAGRTTHVDGMFDKALAFVQNGKKTLEEKLPGIIESIKTVSANFVTELKGIYNSITNPGFTKYDMHSDPYEEIEERNEFIDNLFSKLSVVKSYIDKYWPPIWEKIVSFKNTVATEYAAAMNTIKEVIFGQEIDEDAPRSSFLEKSFEYLSGVTGEIDKFLFGYEETDERYAGRTTHVPGAWERIKHFGEVAYEYVTTEGPVIWGKIKSFYEKYLKPVVDVIFEFAKLLFGAIEGFMSAEVDPNASFADQLAQRLGSFDKLGEWINKKIEGFLGDITGEGGLLSQLSNAIMGFLGIDQQVDEIAESTKKTKELSFIERLAAPFFDLISGKAEAEGADEVQKTVEDTKKKSGGIFGMLSKAGGSVADLFQSLFGNQFFRILGLIFTVKNLSTIVKGISGTKGVGSQISDIMESIGGIIGSMAKLFLVVGLIEAIGGPGALDHAVDSIIKVLDKVFNFFYWIGGGGAVGGILSDVINAKLDGEGEGLSNAANIILAIGTGLKSLMEAMLLLVVNLVVYGILDKILGLFDIHLMDSLWSMAKMLGVLALAVGVLILAVNLATIGMTDEAKGDLFKNMSKITTILDSLVNAIKWFAIAIIAFEIFGGWEKIGPEVLAIGGMLLLFAAMVGGLIYGLIELKKNLIFGNGWSTIGSILSTLGPILLMVILSIAAVAATIVIAANNMPKDLDNWALGLLEAGIAVISLVLGSLIKTFTEAAIAAKAVDMAAIGKTFLIMLVAIAGVVAIMFAIEKLMKVYTKDMSVLIFNLGSDLASFHFMTKGLTLEVFKNAVECLKTVIGGFQKIMLSFVNTGVVYSMMDCIRDSASALSTANTSLKDVTVDNFKKPKEIFTKIQEASEIDPAVDLLITRCNSIRDSGSSLSIAMSNFSGVTQDSINQVGLVKTYAENVKGLADVLNTIPAVNLINASTVGGAVGQLTSEISTDKFSITDTGRIAELDPEKIKAFFRTMADSMPEKEVMDKIANFGDGNNVTSFSMGLTNLTGAVSNYNTALGTVNFDKLALSEQFLTVVDSLGQKLPTDYSFVDSLSDVAEGGKDSRLGKFSNDIQTLGTAIKDYGDAVNSAGAINLIASALFLGKLASIQASLEDKSFLGFIKSAGVFGGRRITLGVFADNVGTIGRAIEGFSTNLQNYDSAKFSAAVKDLEDIAGLSATLRGVMFDEKGQPIMNEVSIIWGLYKKKSADGEDRLSDFGDVISRIGNGIKLFTESLTDDKGNVPDMHKFETQVWFLKELAGLSKEFIGIKFDNYGISNLAEDLGTGAPGEKIVPFINAFSEVDNTATQNARSAVSVLKDLAWAAISFNKTNGTNSFTAASALASVGTTITKDLLPALLKLNEPATNNAVYKLIKLHEALSGEVSNSLSIEVNSVVDSINSKVISPTIRPVVDLSDPTWTTFTGFNGPSVQNRYVMENVNNFKMNDVQNVKMDSADLQNLLTAIGNVGTSVGSVSNSINGMYVRMDTGALVGQLAGPMDAALGRRYGRVTRYSGSYSDDYP